MKGAETDRTGFNGFDYKEVTVEEGALSFYLDCYKNFGWIPDENIPVGRKADRAVLNLKRDRRIINKMELTRLQRHFEACAAEIAALEKSKTAAAFLWAVTAGLLGTAFMAGATFAATAEPPVVWLCCVLAAPGFAGWILPYFLYQRIHRRSVRKLTPLIEEKYDEIYEICQKGFSLLLAIQ